jgi:hypothetical protein
MDAPDVGWYALASSVLIPAMWKAWDKWQERRQGDSANFRDVTVKQIEVSGEVEQKKIDFLTILPNHLVEQIKRLEQDISKSREEYGILRAQNFQQEERIQHLESALLKSQEDVVKEKSSNVAIKHELNKERTAVSLMKTERSAIVLRYKSVSKSYRSMVARAQRLTAMLIRHHIDPGPDGVGMTDVTTLPPATLGEADHPQTGDSVEAKKIILLLLCVTAIVVCAAAAAVGQQATTRPLDALLREVGPAVEAERADAAARVNAAEAEAAGWRAKYESTLEKVDFDVTWIGHFGVRVLVRDHDPRASYRWTWPDGLVTRGAWSGWATDRNGTFAVTLTAVDRDGRPAAPVTRSFTIDAPVRAAVKAGETFPATIPPDTEIDGGGRAFTLAAPFKAGGNVVVRNANFKFAGRAVELAADAALVNCTFTGSMAAGERLTTVRTSGVSIIGGSFGNVASFLEQAAPCDYLTLQGVRQVGPVTRYPLYFSGGRWLVVSGCTLGPSRDEHSLRISDDLERTLTTFAGVTGNTLPTAGKDSGIDVRTGDGIWVEANATEGDVRFGNDRKLLKPAANGVFRGNTAPNVRVVSGATNVTVIDNAAQVSLSAPDVFDGRLGIDGAYVRSDRPVKWYGNKDDVRAFKGVETQEAK